MSPVTPPPKLPDRHYDFGRMNMVFAVSAAALLVVTLLMVYFDYSQPWKRFQAQFQDLERAKILQDLEEERQRINEEEMVALQQVLREEESRLSGQRDELEKLERQLQRLDAKIYEADAATRITKSLLDAARYRYDRALQQGNQEAIDRARAEVNRLSARFMEERKALEEYQSLRAQTAEELDAMQAGIVQTEKRLAELRSGIEGLERRLANLNKDIRYFLLNAPLMDFLSPSLKIEQVILPGLYHDINFTTIERVDRCMTCHLPTTRSGFEGDGWQHPFRSHPRLDLFLSDGSPHPYSRFGCTVCHGGLDRATDFARAGHSLLMRGEEDAAKLARWKQELGWEKQPYLEIPVHPAELSEAGCVTCHAGEVWTPGSEVQDVGRELIVHMGCTGCHAIDYPPFTDLRQAGPALTRIAAKTTPEWAARWIEAPRDFHPTTWMPHFFYLENIQGETNRARQTAEIVAMVAYLWEHSEQAEYPPAPPGNPIRGRELFETVGCTGCHILDADARRDDFYPEIGRLHGPNLIRTGSKVGSGWLYAWLKNPKEYFPDTNMPRLRLTDQEAADLTAYLLSSRDPAYENLKLPEVNPEVRDDLVLSYLQATMTLEQSQARLAAMDEEERDVYLGEQTIRKYGCYGCHEIAGFETAKPIGVELTEEGSKPVHLFDFGHVHDVPHTRHDWIRTKLLRPRIWDHGKELVKNYEELYKMPDFGMSEREATAVLANVLGFTKHSVAETRKAGKGPGAAAIAAGRKLITRYNCQGCHLVEGEGQAIRSAIADVGMLPPNLAAEGARVQADWLFDFLHDPGRVQLRPWLTVRMPTFQFSDQEVNTLVDYFVARDQRQMFLSPPAPGRPRDVAVGEVVFGMLQCAKCHPAGADAAQAVGVAAADLAPSLLIAHSRLRYDWVPPWIKDPQSWIPGTRMPANFSEVGPNQYTSPIVGVIDRPGFADEKAAMLRHFSSEAELKEYLGDVDRVTAALRDYIWTLREPSPSPVVSQAP